MTALRHIKRRRDERFASRWECSSCKDSTATAFCEDCVSAREEEAADEARQERDDGLALYAQSELARVYLDMRYGRHRDARDRLERFIAQARAEGATFVQDVPPACVPLVQGCVTASMEPYVTSPAV